MSTVAEKLLLLFDIKNEIRTLLQDNNSGLPDDADFEDYPDYVDNIDFGSRLETLSVTPSASEWSGGPSDGYDAIEKIIIPSAPNLLPYNVRDNTKLFHVTGDMLVRE